MSVETDSPKVPTSTHAPTAHHDNHDPIIKCSTEDEYNGNRTGLIVVDVSPRYAGPCEPAAAVFKKLKTEFGEEVTFIQATSDDIASLAKYRNRSCPTFLFFANGPMVKLIRGANLLSIERTVREQIQIERSGGNRQPYIPENTGEASLEPEAPTSPLLEEETEEVNSPTVPAPLSEETSKQENTSEAAPIGDLQESAKTSAAVEANTDIGNAVSSSDVPPAPNNQAIDAIPAADMPRTQSKILTKGSSSVSKAAIDDIDSATTQLADSPQSPSSPSRPASSKVVISPSNRASRANIGSKTGLSDKNSSSSPTQIPNASSKDRVSSAGPKLHTSKSPSKSSVAASTANISVSKTNISASKTKLSPAPPSGSKPNIAASQKSLSGSPAAKAKNGSIQGSKQLS